MLAGGRIKSTRNNSKLSQAKFAKEIGYSQGYVRDIELGKVKPSRRILEAISQRFNVSIDWLLTGEDRPSKKPKYEGLRETLLTSHEGNERERIEKALSEGEYTLFERLIVTNGVLMCLDAAVHESSLQKMIVRIWIGMRSEPAYKNDDSFNLLVDRLDDIPKLKSLAIYAFAEGSEALFDFFYQLFVHIEFWDFDFDTFMLKLKPFNRDWRSIPLLISEPQLLFSDEAFEVSNKLSDAVIKTIKEIEASLNIEQKKILDEILAGGIELILKQAINEYRRDHGEVSENSDNKTV